MFGAQFLSAMEDRDGGRLPCLVLIFLARWRITMESDCFAWRSIFERDVGCGACDTALYRLDRRLAMLRQRLVGGEVS